MTFLSSRTRAAARSDFSSALIALISAEVADRTILEALSTRFSEVGFLVPVGSEVGLLVGEELGFFVFFDLRARLPPLWSGFRFSGVGLWAWRGRKWGGGGRVSLRTSGRKKETQVGERDAESKTYA